MGRKQPQDQSVTSLPEGTVDGFLIFRCERHTYLRQAKLCICSWPYSQVLLSNLRSKTDLSEPGGKDCNTVRSSSSEHRETHEVVESLWAMYMFIWDIFLTGLRFLIIVRTQAPNTEDKRVFFQHSAESHMPTIKLTWIITLIFCSIICACRIQKILASIFKMAFKGTGELIKRALHIHTPLGKFSCMYGKSVFEVNLKKKQTNKF